MSPKYTTVNGEEFCEEKEFWTIGDLLTVCAAYPERKVMLVGTQYSPSALHSWRGSYSLPAISYSSDVVTGEELRKSLKADLNKTHTGWKGGEYDYNTSEEFYLSSEGNCNDIKVFDYTLEGENLILITDVDKY